MSGWSPAAPPASPGPPPPREESSDFTLENEQQAELVITPGGGPVSATVRIANTSDIVEAYAVTAVKPPPWLIVTPGQLRLLPGEDGRVEVTFAIAAENLVPVQRFKIPVEAQGESDRGLRRTVRIDAAIGAVPAPVQIRLEPSNVRVRDTTSAVFQVLIDNRRSNVGVTYALTGRDPEQQVRFLFEFPRLNVPPGGTATTRLRVEADLPPAGEQINRTLTVVAANGNQEVSGSAGFTQAASAMVVDPPMGIRLDPSVVHANRGRGATQVILDNRRGTRPQTVQLEADDEENAVTFTVTPPTLQVQPGQWGSANISMRAPGVEPGQEKTRQLTVSAFNGQESISAEGQFIQERGKRRPFLRVLLVLLGSLAMIIGSLLPWTVSPEGTGVQWNYANITAFFGIPPNVVDGILETVGLFGILSTIVAFGIFTIVLGILAALGLFGTGKTIKNAGILGAILLVIFAAGMIAAPFFGQGFPGLAQGYALTLLGCGLVFVGSFFPKPT